MICGKATAYLILRLSAQGYEPENIDMCFVEMKSCEVFKEVIVKAVTEVTNGKVSASAGRCGTLRIKEDDD